MNKPSVLRIGQLHYHLKRCGVRTVIDNLCRSLIAHSRYDPIEIDLITSDADTGNGSDFIDALRQWAQNYPARKIKINAITIPELAYHDQPAQSKEDFIQKSNQLVNLLLGSAGLDGCSPQSPYLLHTHNANLGKNPILTLALKLLADRIDNEHLPLRMIYQMHDFAEDNRPDCWKNLVNASGRPDPALAVSMMYPPNPCIQWACINSTDVEKLTAIGLPKNRITLLPNPLDTNRLAPDVKSGDSSLLAPDVKSGDLSSDIAADLKSRIADYAKQNGFIFHPDRNILLAPIKAIRRKNILESILLLILLNHPHDRYQLLITLRPNSPDDIDYCRSVETLVRDLRLPVVIGFGEHLIAGQHRKITNGRIDAFSLSDLMAIASAVVTTSIQEGFGYIFHEPWLAGNPLIGRDIPHITRDFTNAGMDLSHLYHRLLVPRNWLADQWQSLLDQYAEKITHLIQAMNLPPIDHNKLIESIENAKSVDTADANSPKIDYADLSVETQMALIKDITNNPDKICRVLPSNRNGSTVLNWHAFPEQDTIQKNKNAVIHNYNFASIAQILEKLYHPARQPIDHKPLHAKQIDNATLLAHAIRFDNIRLIR